MKRASQVLDFGPILLTQVCSLTLTLAGSNIRSHVFLLETKHSRKDLVPAFVKMLKLTIRFNMRSFIMMVISSGRSNIFAHLLEALD